MKEIHTGKIRGMIRKIAEENARKITIEARRKTAESEKSAAEELLILAHDPEDYVRYGLVKNQKTRPDLLEPLLRDNNPSIRFAVLQHRNASATFAAALRDDRNLNVRRYARMLLEHKSSTQDQREDAEVHGQGLTKNSARGRMLKPKNQAEGSIAAPKENG